MARAYGQCEVRGRTDWVQIEVITKSAYKEGDYWYTDLTVRAELRGHRPYVGCPLVIITDGVPAEGFPDDIATVEHGLFASNLRLLGPGKYQIGAMIRGTSIMAWEWVTVPEPAKPTAKQPTDMTLTPVGADGIYDLIVNVFSKELVSGLSSGVEGVRIMVSDGGSMLEWGETDSRGIARIPLPYFREKEKTVTAEAVGTGIAKRIKLFGPLPALAP